MAKRKLGDPTQNSYKTSFEKAAWLIYAFLRQPELYKLAVQEAIGGTVYKDVFSTRGIVYQGTMGWFCRNGQGGDFPKLFLALEDGTYDIGKVPNQPDKGELVYTTSPFTYTNYLSEEGVMDMLQNDRRPLTADGSIKREDVMPLLNQLPSDPVLRRYNGYPCGFFENRVNKDIDEFINSSTALVAVRYYFGYDDSDHYYFESNRIRIILVGVDENGKNIMPTGDLSRSSPAMIENSWPPPPPL